MRRLITYCAMVQRINLIVAPFIIVAILVSFSACKKDHTDPTPSIPRPLAMTVVSGNNQVGYPSRPLEDTIVIKVTPKNKTDIEAYSYFFKGFSGFLSVIYTYTLNDEYYIKAVWTLAGNTTPQQMTMLLFGDCPNPYTGSCKALDSLVLKATVNNRPWVQVFADNSGSIGPGDFWGIHFSDASHGIVVGDSKTGLLTTGDGGATWNYVTSFRDDNYGLAFSNKDTGLIVTTNNYAYFTYDGGNSFTGVSWSPPFIGHLSSADYYMVNRNVIYSVGNQGNLAKSVNGGMGWTRYPGFTFINRINSITCPDASTCYACGQVAKIVKTSDGGNSWVEQPILLNNNLRKIYFIDTNFGFAGGQYGALVRTTDGGAHWSIIPTGLHFEIIEIRFFDINVGFIISTGGEIAKTTDGGLTWKIVVRDNYGVGNLNQALIKDATTAFGLQWQTIFKYDLR